MNILIIDDDKDILEMMKSLLSDLGHKVLIANDAVKAHSMIQSADWDLVLIDTLQERRHLNALALSGGALTVRFSGYEDSKLDRDYSLVLSKPFDRCELDLILRSACG